jgi:uncharacterized protein YkwD
MSYYSLKTFAELPVDSIDISEFRNNALQNNIVKSNVALNLHNNIRQSLGLNKLIWDQNLAGGSISHSSLLSKTRTFEHSKGNYGENLYMGTPSMKDAVNAWLSEQENYSGQKIGSGDFPSYGHYTQMVFFFDNTRYFLQ